VRQFRLTQLQVLIAAGAVAVGIVGLFFFAFIKPQRSTIARTNANAQSKEEFAQNNRRVFEKKLADAKVMEKEILAKYDAIMKNRMPDVSLKDRMTTMFDLWDLPRKEGPVLERWFASTGAVVTGFSFPAFGTTPPPPGMRMLPPLSWNLSVTVKDFPAFLKWLEKLPKAPRFLVLNNISLPGMRQPGTPFTANISVTLYEWIRVPALAAAAPPTQEAETAGAPGAGAGRAGGRGRRRGGGGPRAGM